MTRTRHARLPIRRTIAILNIAILTAIAVPATATTQVAGQDAGAATVGTAFLKAVQAADWRAAASFLDLAVLDSFRRSQAEGARRQRTRPPMTVERLMRIDTALPRAVAEYQVKQMNALERSQSFLERAFGLADPDSLLALPIEIVAQRWLEIHDRRWMTRQAMRSSNCLSAGDSLPMAGDVHEVLGTIVRDSLAYLLHQVRDEPSDLYAIYARPALVMILHRSRDTWWVVPRDNLMGTLGVAVRCERTK